MRQTWWCVLGSLAILGGFTGCDGCERAKRLGQDLDLVDPDTPQTPSEKIFVQQLAVLQEARTIVAAVEKKEVEPGVAVANLMPLKERLRELQAKYEANGQTIQNFRPSLRDAYASLLKEMTLDKVTTTMRSGLSGRSGAGEVAREVEEILTLMGPKRSDEKTKR